MLSSGILYGTMTRKNEYIISINGNFQYLLLNSGIFDAIFKAKLLTDQRKQQITFAGGIKCQKN